MSSRVADLLASQTKPRGPRCMVGVALESYPPKERAEWIDAFSSSNVMKSQIHRALNADGRSVSVNAVQRHARGECACG